MSLTTGPNPSRAWTGVHLVALAVPHAAGLVAYGWRALMATLLVLGGTMLAWVVLRKAGRKGPLIDPLHAAWSSLLLAALLPAHLAGSGVPSPGGLEPTILWPVLPATGLFLGLMLWLLGGRAGGRVSPALATYVILAFTLGGAVVPHLALRREVAVTGDLLDYERRPIEDLAGVTWLNRDAPDGVDGRDPVDARYQAHAADVLAAFTSGRDRPDRRRYSIESVLRERMPPPEDLILIGHPSPIGMASAGAVIAAGMILFFRGVADARISAMVIASAYAAFAIAPVPRVLTPDGPIWAWPLVGGAGIPWDVGLTFVHYELLAGPILFAAVLVAPLPSLRPLSSGWRMVYAALIGVAMAMTQRYLDPTVGPLAALLLVSLLTPFMESWTRARTLV